MAAAAEYFEEGGSPFVIIENNPAQAQRIREKGFNFTEGDATLENVLLEAGIKSASGLLALLNSDPDNLFVVLTGRELNPTLHITRDRKRTRQGKKFSGLEQTVIKILREDQGTEQNYHKDLK